MKIANVANSNIVIHLNKDFSKLKTSNTKYNSNAYIKKVGLKRT